MNLQHDDAKLVECALRKRKRYMDLSEQRLSKTADLFIRGTHPKQQANQNLPLRANPPPNFSYHVPSAYEIDPFEVSNVPASMGFTIVSANGIMQVNDIDGNVIPALASAYVPFDQFCGDFEEIYHISRKGTLRTVCSTKLQLSALRFRIYSLQNSKQEIDAQAKIPGREFHTVRRVDTHIHPGRSLTPYELTVFIKNKLVSDGMRVVTKQNGVGVTLKAVFESLRITPEELTTDILEVRADHDIFERFDLFDARGMPAGKQILRKIFLKTDNDIGGSYFAEMLKGGFSKLESRRYDYTELRLSIYGKSRSEWDQVAEWTVNHRVHSAHNRWVVQLPRLYDKYRSSGTMRNFKELLDNFFVPLFEATNDPGDHLNLHLLLRYVVGIDLVGDESKRDIVRFGRENPSPGDWDSEMNPPYAYYVYYFFINLAALNQFRKLRGMNTFALRPHCGESGSRSHLVAGFLTSESIVHGLKLEKSPVLQYLFYLAQVPIAMSPASSNKLFLTLSDNPFPSFFKQGLLVSLSTDDPLQFHLGKEDPLSEEYSLAHHIWQLNNVDLCELARNSIFLSGFPDKVKKHWLGGNYQDEGPSNHDCARTNIPDMRIKYRYEALTKELKKLFESSGQANDGSAPRPGHLGRE